MWVGSHQAAPCTMNLRTKPRPINMLQRCNLKLQSTNVRLKCYRVMGAGRPMQTRAPIQTHVSLKKSKQCIKTKGLWFDHSTSSLLFGVYTNLPKRACLETLPTKFYINLFIFLVPSRRRPKTCMQTNAGETITSVEIGSGTMILVIF